MKSIRLAKVSDLEALCQLFVAVKMGLRQIGLDQWPDHYPDRCTVESDIQRGEVFVMVEQGQLIGSLTLNQHQDKAYENITWAIAADAPFVIHRLIVAPDHWGQRLGQQWMAFAEEASRSKGGQVIRLDTWADNIASNKLYQRLGYQLAEGSCYFYGPEKRFVCYEKQL